MEIFSRLESWDYLAAFMLVFSLWLLLGGIGRLKAANPEQVDEKKLRTRAVGGALAAVAYLFCKAMV